MVSWIKESELLKKNHLCVKYLFDGLDEHSFERDLKCLAGGYGFGIDGGACYHWDSLDEAGKAESDAFEGVEFSMPILDLRVVLSYDETIYYMKVACKNYCKSHPEAKTKLDGYIKAYAKLKGLE